MFAETADELLLTFREDVHDDATYSPGDDSLCLWKDREIYRYMTVAVDRLARDTEGLVEVIKLPFSAGEPLVKLPARVLEIRYATNLTHMVELRPANADQRSLGVIDDYGQRSFAPVGTRSIFGKPHFYVRDRQVRALELTPIPDTAGELEISCTVTVDERLEAGTDLPFLEAIDQELLLEYMKYQAYRKQDVEAEDLTRSNAALTAYRLGWPARKAEINNYRRTPGAVRMNW